MTLLTEPTRIIFRKAHVTEREAVLSTFSTATRNYLLDVEAADQQTLEPEVLKVMGQFAEYRIPLGGACCLMAGARTLAGALVPMVGAAPTNVGGLFVAGDYDRVTGLVGDGSTKYLDSNRAGNADGQDNNHCSFYATSPHSSGNGRDIITSLNNSSINSSAYTATGFKNKSPGAFQHVVTPLVGFTGMSRNSVANFAWRTPDASGVVGIAASRESSDSYIIFGTSNPRLSYYSIGPAVDLEAMDTAITTCMNALAAAGI